jgi:hypothetical protein
VAKLVHEAAAGSMRCGFNADGDEMDEKDDWLEQRVQNIVVLGFMASLQTQNIP